jgi:hypothetical protein
MQYLRRREEKGFMEPFRALRKQNPMKCSATRETKRVFQPFPRSKNSVALCGAQTKQSRP